MLPDAATSFQGMRRMTYENAVSLFRKGKLGQVIESLRSESLSPDFDLDRKVFLAYALAMAGETSFAGAMSTIAAHQLAPKVRSQLETARGIVSWRSGDSESAWRHLNLAVQSAALSRDAER